jgi:hypothetical protein
VGTSFLWRLPLRRWKQGFCRTPSLTEHRGNTARHVGKIGVVLALAFGCYCCSSSPTGPTTNPATGTWTGTVADSFAGQGALQFVLNPSMNSITLPGTWSATFSSSTTASGQLSITIESGSLLLRCEPSGGLVSGTIRIADAHLTGSYANVNSLPCPQLANGSIDLVRQ